MSVSKHDRNKFNKNQARIKQVRKEHNMIKDASRKGKADRRKEGKIARVRYERR